jgi:dihydropteroate synthase
MGDCRGVGIDVFDSPIVLGRAIAIEKPLVEGVLEFGVAAVLGPAFLAEPVEEIRLVGFTDDGFMEGFAIDRRRLVTAVEMVVAVDEPAGVTGRAEYPAEPDDALSGLKVHSIDGFHLAVIGEHSRLLESPAPESNRDLVHVSITRFVPKSRASVERAVFAAGEPISLMQTVEAAGLSIGDDHPPRIMGVLNVSDESPYEPSVFANAGEAAEYVDGLIAEGADIIDVGLESANKRFDVLTPDEELDRLDTALETIERVRSDAVFSIETRYHEVAKAALDAGFDMVNDICGFADPEMPRVCAERDAAVVKMASPPDLSRPGALRTVEEIYDALDGELTAKTIIDPAFGGWSEAKTLDDDREIFHRLDEFCDLARPMLVSINRKNFLGDIVNRETADRLPASLAATALAVERGADVIRTHDVAETRDAALIGDALGDQQKRAPNLLQ